MFYNYQKLLSYNAMFNFVIGERGVGKTYGALKFVVNNFLNKQEQFIYLRRYKTELPSNIEKLFGKLIKNEEFGDHELTLVKNKDSCTIKIDGEIAGYCIPLSTSLILKSNDFSDVKTIIYDEFIIEKSAYRYLQNEVHHLLEFVETVGRLRDIRVLFLGNAIQKANPYFNYFKLDTPYNSEFKTYKDGLILVNYIKNLEYRTAKRASKFGRLIDGTAYGSYAIDNKFLHENATFIEKHDGHAKFFFSMIIDGYKLGIWSNPNNGKVYFSNKYDSACQIIYTVNTTDHNENTTLIKATRSTFMLTILEKYRQGLVCFENQLIKALVLPVLNKYCN